MSNVQLQSQLPEERQAALVKEDDMLDSSISHVLRRAGSHQVIADDYPLAINQDQSSKLRALLELEGRLRRRIGRLAMQVGVAAALTLSGSDTAEHLAQPQPRQAIEATPQAEAYAQVTAPESADQFQLPSEAPAITNLPEMAPFSNDIIAQPGDSLWRIAERLLADANLTNPTLIQINTVKGALVAQNAGNLPLNNHINAGQRIAADQARAAVADIATYDISGK